MIYFEPSYSSKASKRPHSAQSFLENGYNENYTVMIVIGVVKVYTMEISALKGCYWGGRREAKQLQKCCVVWKGVKDAVQAGRTEALLKYRLNVEEVDSESYPCGAS